CGDRASASLAVSLFRPLGVRVTVMPLAAHDPLMADVQALPRLASLAFALALARGRRTARGLARVATPSLRRQLEVSRHVAREAPELSFGIQALNPASIRALDRLAASLAQLRATVRSGDARSFHRALQSARAVLAGP
ncbi:MAG TPA: prephenate dehydrogenase dimerization domain-containing protein, partial [Thermoplasmata archaeon]